MKYFLSLLCIIKDERYLEEFIIYNHILGVEHFYIYDNESKEPILSRLSHPFFKKMCTIIYFPGKAQQINAYHHCLKRVRNVTKWLIIIDGDEFILPKKHNSLRDFLDQYEEYAAIGINWMMFGSSFHNKIQPGFLINNYTYCEGIQNQHIKTICKPNQVLKFLDPHHVKLKNPKKYVDPYKRIISGPFNNEPTLDIIQINHYWGKSAEEHYEKQNRGRADAETKSLVLNKNIHEKFNKIQSDFIIKKYLNPLKKLYYGLSINIELYKLLNPKLDLKNLNEYQEHLFKHGLFEDFRYYVMSDKYPKFNHEIYRKNYKDLEKMSKFELEKHYIKHGINEKRIADKNIK